MVRSPALPADTRKSDPRPPRRLFLVGYWMIQACCALGIALHYNLTKDMMSNHASRWFQGLLATGCW